MDPVTGLMFLGGAAVNYVSNRKKAKAEAKANEAAAAQARQEALFAIEEAKIQRSEIALDLEDIVLSRDDSLAQLGANATAADYNAAIADQEAEQLEQQYGQLERAQRISSTKALATIHLQAAAGGFTLAGSARDVERESRVNAELDALNVRYEGILKVKSAREQGDLARFEAAGYRTAAGNVSARSDVAYRRGVQGYAANDLAMDRARAGLGQAARISENTADIRRAGVYNTVSTTLNDVINYRTASRPKKRSGT